MKRWAVYLLLLLLAVTPGLAMAQATTAPATTRASEARPLHRGGNAVVIVLQGMIDDFNRDHIFKRVEEARAMGASVVILKINTYGGLVTAGLETSQFLKQQDDLHIIGFVDDKAISAGAMIALACDEIVMEPGSKIGDSAPIATDATGGLVTLGEAERAKAESPILADFYESAIENGYDPLLASAMVANGVVVHWVENDAGERRFVEADEYTKLIAAGWRPVPGVPNPVDGPTSLLTAPSSLAVTLGLATEESPSVDSLARERGYTIVATLEPSTGEKFVGWLNGPIVRFILMILFMQSLYAALHAPGHGFAEVFALTSLALLIGIPALTGYAQWWEIVLIVVGFVLLALEIFVIPGFGVPGFAGIAMILVGLILTFVGDEPIGIPGVLPTLATTWAALQRGLVVVVSGLVCSLLLWLWLSRYLPKLPYFNRLILADAVGNVETPTTLMPGSDIVWPAVGSVGRAVSDLRPGGAAEFTDSLIDDTRVVDVVSDSGFVSANTKIVVREVAGSRVVVRPVEKV